MLKESGKGGNLEKKNLQRSRISGKGCVKNVWQSMCQEKYLVQRKEIIGGSVDILTAKLAYSLGFMLHTS